MPKSHKYTETYLMYMQLRHIEVRVQTSRYTAEKSTGFYEIKKTHL